MALLDSSTWLVTAVKRNEVDFFAAFGGKDEDLPKLFAEIKEYHEGKPLIHDLWRWQRAAGKSFPEMEFIEDRDNWDYVYLRENWLVGSSKYLVKIITMRLKEYPDMLRTDRTRELRRGFGGHYLRGAKRVGEDEPALLRAM